MKGRLIAAAFSLFGLVDVSASGARAGDDPRAATEAIVFGSAATQAAYARWGDDTLRGERQRIDALIATARSGDRRAGRDLVGAEAAFDGVLAAKDRPYARVTAALRAAAVGLAATPAGRVGLSRFAGGDEAGALAALDALPEAARKHWIAMLAWDARQRGKLTTDQLIVRYEALVRANPLAADGWVRLHDLYRDSGRTADARRAIETAARVAADDTDVGLALGDLGRELMDDGDLDGASQAVARGLPVFRRLAAADPADRERARDLALALMLRGYDLALRRDRAGARQPLEEGVEIWRAVASSRPSDDRTDDFVAVALGLLGGILADQGDLAAARRVDEEAHAAFRRLSQADPSNSRWATMADATLGALAEVAYAQGDRPAADQAYGALLAHLRQRVGANPADLAAARVLAVTLQTVAASLTGQGDLAAARADLTESLSIARRLASAHPGDPLAGRTIAADDLSDLGDLSSRQGDLLAARRVYGESLALYRRVAATGPSGSAALAGVAATLEKIGQCDAAEGGFAAARLSLEESLAIARHLGFAQPATAGFDDLIAYDLGALGDIHTAQGDLAGADGLFSEGLALSRRLAAAPLDQAARLREVVSLVKIAAVRVGRDDASARASLRQAAGLADRLARDVPADARVRALASAVMDLGGSSAGLTWAGLRAMFEGLIRGGVLPADQIVWLRATRIRAAGVTS